MDPSDVYKIVFPILTPILIFILILFYLRKSSPSKITDPNSILIIGGSSGLGLELAKLYNQKFPRAKILLLSRGLFKLEQAKQSLPKPENVLIIPMDITQNQTQNHEQIIKNLQDNFDQALGQKNQTPDILICSAGKAVSGAFENIPVADFQNQMDLHYFSCVLPVKAFIEGMKKRESGRICFVSSVGGQLGVWGFSAYSSSKFAVVGLAQVLSNELSPYNISVTVSYPPDMDTPGFQEEMKTKPWECNKISETGGLVTADFVAQKLFTDIQAGNFSASSNLDSWLSTVGSIGWSPSSSVLQTFCEVCFGGLIRLILLGYGKYFDYVSYQGKEMRKRGTYPKPNAEASSKKDK